MNQGTFEFSTSKNVHQWIVNGMDEEQICQVRIYKENSWAVCLEPNTPINSDGIQGDWESTETKR